MLVNLIFSFATRIDQRSELMKKVYHKLKTQKKNYFGPRRLDGAEEASVLVQVIVRRIGSGTAPLKDRFLVLATSGVDLERGPTLYRRRWEVEILFAALKSRGLIWRRPISPPRVASDG